MIFAYPAHITLELTPEQVFWLVIAGLMISIALAAYTVFSHRNGSGHV